MLHHPLILRLAFLALPFAGLCPAQVQVDVPLELSGPEEQRTIDGLATPAQEDALLARSALVAGTAHWTEATAVSGGVALAGAGGLEALPDGGLLRFLSPGNLFGPLTVRLNNGTPQPLVRADGLPLVSGDLRNGAVGEIIASGGRWVLVSPHVQGCPAGAIPVNERYCIDAGQSAGSLTFYQAMDHCAIKGGRLCKWDEYHHACTTVAPQLTGLFNDWEWIDDTSNHVHIGDQAGRTTCMSQRSETISFLYPARCCYPRP
ncbi:MAG: hypothetical protein R2817_08470 [Flavobacteriales bacterium]